MLIAFVIGGALSTIVIVVGGLLGLIGFVAEAPKEFPDEFGTAATPSPTHLVVTELCRHEIPGVHGTEGRVLMVELPPGVHGDPHRCPGALFAHGLQGTVMSVSEDAPPQQHGPGDTRFEPPTGLALRESNKGWETAKLLIFDLAERDQLLEFVEPAKEGMSAPHAETRAHTEASFILAGHDTGGSR